MEREGYDNVFVMNWWELVEEEIKETCRLPISHACEAETSIALALDQRVLMERAKGVIVNETPIPEAPIPPHNRAYGDWSDGGARKSH